MRTYWILLLIGLVSATARAAGGYDPIIGALPAPTPPQIDGSLDDPCWQTAETTRALAAIGGAAVPVATVGQLCWDRDCLYLAVRCAEPRLALLRQRAAAHRLGPMEESIEIFVAPVPDRQAYWQFRVDLLGHQDTHRRNDAAPELDRQWRSAVKLTTDAWTVEIAIPFKFFGVSPGPGSLWGLNLNRQRLVEPGPPWTCWSDTQGGFHNPARFGHLIFAEYPAWLAEHYGNLIGAAASEVQNLERRYPASATPPGPSWQELADQAQAFQRAVRAAKITTGAQCQPLIKSGEDLVAAHEAALARLRLAIIKRGFQ